MSQLIARLETLLFLSGQPVSLARIGKVLGCSRADVLAAIQYLKQKLASDKESGLCLIEHAGEVELATKGEYASVGEAFLEQVHEENLSRAALEVLAIIAYRAPVTRAQVEAIRGVNCSFTLRNLLIRGLIERFENPADTREYVYQPTFALLERLGLHSIEDLPEYPTLAHDERLQFSSTAVTDRSEPNTHIST